MTCIEICHPVNYSSGEITDKTNHECSDACPLGLVSAYTHTRNKRSDHSPSKKIKDPNMYLQIQRYIQGVCIQELHTMIKSRSIHVAAASVVVIFFFLLSTMAIPAAADVVEHTFVVSVILIRPTALFCSCRCACFDVFGACFCA